MKKRLLSLVLVFLIISMPIGFSSDALFSNMKVPRVEQVVSEEREGEGITRYVYGSGLVASVKSGEINYYHSDRIGSNRLITDSSGSVEEEFKSLPFGQEISNSGVRYSFATGKELDESNLYYFGARYYDQNLGMFTSVDPVASEPSYHYVRNNPLNLVDPTGMAREHVVESGDTLFSISEQYSTSVDELVKLNNIKDADKINIDQKIILPDFSLSETSKDRLTGVDKDLVKVITEAQKDSPYEFQVVDGKRTAAEQAEHYKKGREWKGTGPPRDPTASNLVNWKPIKTNKAGKCVGCVTWTLKSKHIDGKAVDLIEGNAISYDWSYPHVKEISAHIKATATRLGITIEWGGDWKDTPPDKPHWQIK